MSLHYYAQFEEFKTPDQIMRDVYHGIKPYLHFNESVKSFIETQKAIKFKVKHLEQAPDYEELLYELDTAETDEEREKIKQLLAGHWYELDENPQLEKSFRFLETIFDQESFYQNQENGKWRKEDKVKVLYSDLDQLVFCLDKKIDGSLLFIRPNTVQYWRVIEAIKKLMDAPARFHAPLLRLFETDIYEVDWPEFDPVNVKDYYFLKEDRSGSDLQREFVGIALGTPDFALLNGPPGTGKTQVICEIIMQEILQGKKVMLVASTHVAVDNVLERLMSLKIAQETILPIRIATQKRKIALTNKKFAYAEISKTEKQRIFNRLRKIKNRSPSQQILFEALQKKNNKVMDKAILDAANLVCGTTIGILQYPYIKNFQGNKSRPLFDLLILDEASKTPFYEFIVPAVWASKWILTGDPKQLSPYVDEYDVHTSLKSVIEQFKLNMDNLSEDTETKLNGDDLNKDAVAKLNALNTLLPYLSLKVPTKNTKPLKYKLLVMNIDLLEFHKHHISLLRKKYPSLRVLNLDALHPYKENPQLIETILFSTQIIVTSIETLKEMADFIPQDVEVCLIDCQISDLPVKIRRRLKMIKTFETDDDFNWINQISYRLGRRYELRDNPDAKARKEEEISKIVPTTDEIIKKIKEVEQVFFPSVLESLLIGFERTNPKWGSTITDGLPEKAKNQRFRLLKYQHRMHPEISKFIREHIYDNKSMLDAEGMADKRSDWRKCPRIMWNHVLRKVEKGKKEPTDNYEEVKAIIEDLDDFLKWAEQEKRETSIAVLTFYRAQERMLRTALRKLFRQKNKIRYFQKENIHLELCTVDRFQGHEADIVFLSMVNNTRIGFLDSPNRLNVALSRARYELQIYGNVNFFKNCRSKLLKILANSLPINKKYAKGEVLK